MLTDYIRQYVKGECSKSLLGREFYEQHILMVAEYGTKLARVLNADEEIVELASYLHDLSAILDFRSVQDHAKKGALLAETLLNQFNYPKERIEMVKQCIVSHSAPLSLENASAEEVCVSNADAMSQIIKPFYWLYYAVTMKKTNYYDSKKWYSNWIKRSWESLVQPAREFIQDDYQLTLKILKTN